MKVLPVMILVLVSFAFATIDSSELSAARQIIGSNVSCDELSEDQLELLGEYYMEQMHPGEQHEVMDRMMGGEGSESLRLQHIQMAEVFYCGRTDTNVTYGGMMAMMPMFYRGWMPGAGGWGPAAGGGMMGYGYDMMGGYGWVFGFVFWVLVLVALVLLIFWLYRNIAGRPQNAEEVLKQRYAKGEITKKQYDEIRKDLQ
ncbi:MAG: SHOCT domain-containing protein [Candidatus Micrarchaeota archaeon]